jgi:transposase-like protein
VYEKKRAYPLVFTKITVPRWDKEDTLMQDDSTRGNESREVLSFWSTLEEYAREGARKMLQQALVNEVEEYLAAHAGARTESGTRAVVRNGYLPERALQTGLGHLTIRQPRVRERRPGRKFTSNILPPFMRRVPSLDALIPVLYLKGISMGDMSEALESILGRQAYGLSATNIMRLKESWKEEYEEWTRRDLSTTQYVYWWADGIYFNVRLDTDRPCMLVLMGARADGTKEVVALWDGHRESKASWQEVLRELKARGLPQGPKLAIGDGALGFWAALEEEFPATPHQRCWVHKTANILDNLPKSVQPYAKKLIHEIYLSPTRAAGVAAYERFIREFEAKYPKTVTCLTKDRDVLFTFYDFPAHHWAHLRSTNPIESTFATVRHRTRQTKGCGSRLATLTMVYKLSREAEKHWRKLNRSELIEKVLAGKVFVDGELQQAA